MSKSLNDGSINDNLPQAAAAQHNFVLPFYLTGSDEETTPRIRGRITRLAGPVESILARHNYPDAVAELTAEAMALAACLSTTLKFDGVFTLQAKGDGAVKTLFADVTNTGAMRAYAAFDDDSAKDMKQGLPAILPKMMGGGYMAFTVDQRATAQRYQGIVELDGPHLGDAAVAWFKNSEQLGASVLTAAQRTDAGWVASALMLQQIAADGGTGPALSSEEAGDLWHTAMVLQSSVERGELLDVNLPLENLLYRLFNAMGPRTTDIRQISDQCRCSSDKVEAMLLGLGEDDVRSLADESGKLIVDCEFCKISRVYTEDQLAKLR